MRSLEAAAPVIPDGAMRAKASSAPIRDLVE
jgi:hypothetical protein